MQTQVIVVTHKRKTMEAGSVLYGVTMQEPGVSKFSACAGKAKQLRSRSGASPPAHQKDQELHRYLFELEDAPVLAQFVALGVQL